MIPIASLLIILGLSLFIVRVAGVALQLTGLSRDTARFQALSAFSGVGFTTNEAEQIVSNPVRRRIAMWLMLIGNVGLVSGTSAALLSVIDLRAAGGASTLLPFLIGGLALLFWIGSSRWFDDRMCALIRWAIVRWTALDAQDYSRLLHLGDAYSVTRVRVEDGHWLAGLSLARARLRERDLLVLGIERGDGSFVGAPRGDAELRPMDEFLVYGHADNVNALCESNGPDPGAGGAREKDPQA